MAGIAPWSLGPTRGLNTLLVRLPTDSVLVSATGEAGAGARLVGPAPDTLVVQPGRRLALRAQIAALHRDLRATMIFVTHDQVEAMTLADRICVLRDGRVEQVGTPAELYERPNSVFVAGFIGSPKMNFLEGAFAERHGCHTLGIRSEHVEIVPEGAGEWSGTVVHAEDLGSDHYLFVNIGAPEPLIVRRPGKLDVSLGSSVTLKPIAAHLHRFDPEGRPLRRG